MCKHTHTIYICAYKPSDVCGDRTRYRRHATGTASPLWSRGSNGRRTPSPTSPPLLYCLYTAWHNPCMIYISGIRHMSTPCSCMHVYSRHASSYNMLFFSAACMQTCSRWKRTRHERHGIKAFGNIIKDIQHILRILYIFTMVYIYIRRYVVVVLLIAYISYTYIYMFLKNTANNTR